MLLFGCGKKFYQVDYCGEQGFYENAKDSYREGERVILKYGLIATDTNYSFYMDDELVDYDYEDGAYILQFIMPDHDIKLECRTTNTMVSVSLSITVQNKLSTADIWILPDTEENRKNTVWETATLSNLEAESNQSAFISGDFGENGLYLFRMIDEDQMYYAVDGIKLECDQTIVICENDGTVTMEIYDEAGTKISEYEMFAARL